jgi:hypothetical protein
MATTELLDREGDVIQPETIHDLMKGHHGVDLILYRPCKTHSGGYGWSRWVGNGWQLVSPLSSSEADALLGAAMLLGLTDNG